MTWGLLLVLMVLCAGAVAQMGSPDDDNDESRLLSRLLQDYNRNFRPGYKKGPVLVSIEVFIKRIDFSKTGQTADVKMDFDLSWRDERLTYRDTGGISSVLRLQDGMWDVLWIPDIIFSNALSVESKFAYRLITLRSTGDIQYKSRIQLTVGVSTDWQKFPYDNPRFEIRLESNGYTLQDLVMSWKGSGVSLGREAGDDSASLRVTGTGPQNYTESLVSGTYQQHIVQVDLSRNLGRYFAGHVYAPSIILVVLSFVGFWLKSDVISGRLILGLLTALILIVIFVSMQGSVPSGVLTGLDLWFNACVLFVLFTLLELALVVFIGQFAGDQHQTSHREEDAGTKKNILGDSRVQKIQKGVDVVSGILFPLGFIVFNIVYWASF